MCSISRPVRLWARSTRCLASSTERVDRPEDVERPVAAATSLDEGFDDRCRGAGGLSRSPTKAASTSRTSGPAVDEGRDQRRVLDHLANRGARPARTGRVGSRSRPCRTSRLRADGPRRRPRRRARRQEQRRSVATSSPYRWVFTTITSAAAARARAAFGEAGRAERAALAARALLGADGDRAPRLVRRRPGRARRDRRSGSVPAHSASLRTSAFTVGASSSSSSCPASVDWTSRSRWRQR